MADSVELSPERIMPLARDLMEVCKRHMAEVPAGRDNVFMCLNALGITTASVLCGTKGPRNETPAQTAISFFNDALSRQIREMIGFEGEGSLNG